MAEENTSQNPQLDQNALSQMIAKAVTDSFSSAREAERQHTQELEAQREAERQTQESQDTTSKDPWADLIDPVVNPRLQQNELTARAAQDKVDFYTSDEWLNIEEHLVLDEDTDIKKAKSEFRNRLETTFNRLLKSGRGLPRTDIAQFLLGEDLVKKGSKHRARIIKNAEKDKEEALNKAKRHVTVDSGLVSDFDPSSVYAMPGEKMMEQFSNVAF